MSARKPKPGVTRLGRFVRRWRFDRNPLRRATDRAETALLAVLVAAFLIGAPFAALATGAWVHGMAQRAQLAQEASRRQVTAVVLAVTTPSAGRRRTLPGRHRHGGRRPMARRSPTQVPVPSGTAVGGTLQVWTDRTGDFDHRAAPRLPGGRPDGFRRSAGADRLSRAYSPWPGRWPSGHSTSAGWPPGTRTGTRRVRAGQPAPEDASCAPRDEGPVWGGTSGRGGRPGVAEDSRVRRERE